HPPTQQKKKPRDVDGAPHPSWRPVITTPPAYEPQGPARAARWNDIHATVSGIGGLVGRRRKGIEPRIRVEIELKDLRVAKRLFVEPPAFDVNAIAVVHVTDRGRCRAARRLKRSSNRPGVRLFAI